MTPNAFRITAKLILCATLAFAASTVCAANYDFKPQPDWVAVNVAQADAPAPVASDGIRYLSSDDQVNLAGERPVWYRRVAYWVDEARALSSAGQITIGYQPEYQKARIHSIEVWREGVREDRRAQARIEVLRRETDLEAGLMDGMHTLSITIPDLRVGDRIEYSFSIEGFNPVFGRAYYDTYSAAYSEPLAFKRVKVIYPPGIPLRWKVGRPEYRVSEGEAGAARYVEIAASKLPKVEEEADAPGTFDPYGKIEISTAADWNDIARWAAGIYPTRFHDRVVADALAKRLKLDPSDAYGSMQRAIAYAQGEIRYTGLDMGVNSHAPHAPETTVARRFGDCKDKSVLLVALLREAGIDARPALVNTVRRTAIATWIPSAVAFDHVVVQANVRGKTYWIDPTRDPERDALESRDPLPFGLALLVDAQARRLVDIPFPEPAAPQVDVGQHLRIGKTNGRYRADFVVATDYRGLKADGIRVDFQSQGVDAIGKSYLAYMRNFYDGMLQTAPPRLEDAESGHVARAVERYRLEWDASETNGFTVALFQLADWIPILKLDSRESPLALNGPRFARQVVRTEVAQGWSLREARDTVRNPYFVFTRTILVKGRTMTLVGEWRRLANEVPAKDYPRLKKDMARARGLLEFTIDLNVGYGRILDTGFRAWRWPLAAIAVLAASLFVLWLIRAHNALAGMFYRPRSAIPSRLRADRILPSTLALMVATMLLDVLIDRGAEYADQPTGEHLAAMFGAGLGFFLRLFLYAAGVRWVFKLLSKSVPYRSMVAAIVWGGFPPVTLFLACGLIAVGFDIRVFAENYVAEAEQMPGVVLAAGLAGAGCLWGLVGLLNAYSVAAGTSRRFALGAMCLTFVIALVILTPLFLLFVAAK